MSERVAGICAELIRRRVVSRDDLPDLEHDLTLRDEVSRRLAEVGLVLLERPGVPFWGVAVVDAYRSVEKLSAELDSRALGLLLYLWLQLVAPYFYSEQPPPSRLSEIVVSEDALLRELPGHWAKTSLQRALSQLRRLRFVETVRGAEAVCAGPMLWLAINHEGLLQALRAEKGLPKALERYLKQNSETSQGAI
jgi:hypothetical protein